MLKKFLDWFLSTLDLRPLFERLGGRSTALAILILFMGTGLALVDRLTAEWVTLGLGIIAAVKVRAALGDKWTSVSPTPSADVVDPAGTGGAPL